MKKFRLFVDMDKEEQYLNRMAKNGCRLTKYSSLGVYTFVPAEPADLHYKIDYRVFKRKSEFEQYVTLFEDAGWEHVCGTRYSGGQFFLPGTGNRQTPEIFSDTRSRADRYKRFFDQSLYGFMCMLIYVVAVFGGSGFKFPGFAYLTPGLWEKKGLAFWWAFLFETPFVLLRFVPLVIFFILTVLYGYFAFKAQKLYKKSLEEGGCVRL